MEIMRPATAAELPDEQALFYSAWEVVKKYRYINQGPEYQEAWRELIRRLEALEQIGEGTPCQELSKSLSRGIANYLEQWSFDEGINSQDAHTAT